MFYGKLKSSPNTVFDKSRCFGAQYMVKITGFFKFIIFGNHD